MSYLNTGAMVTESGLRVASKKRLKEMIKADPRSVTFDPTSMFDNQAHFDGASIPAGVTLSVVGPDPQRDRRWYATVEVTSKGVRVS